MLTSKTALETRFRAVRRGGIDPVQVEDFRRQAAEALITLERKIRDLVALDHRSKSDVAMAEVMAAALESKAHILDAARERADSLLARAETEAGRLIADAASEVDDLRRQVDVLRSEAEAIRGERFLRVPQSAPAIAWEGTGPGAVIDLVAIASTEGNGDDDPLLDAPHAYVVLPADDAAPTSDGESGRRGGGPVGGSGECSI